MKVVPEIEKYKLKWVVVLVLPRHPLVLETRLPFCQQQLEPESSQHQYHHGMVDPSI